MKYYNFTNIKKSTNFFVFLKEVDFRGAYGKKYQNSSSVSQFDIFPFFGNIEKNVFNGRIFLTETKLTLYGICCQIEFS